MFRVLLVDDDPEESILVERTLRYLTRDNFELVYAAWCIDAIETLAVRSFDLICLDNQMRRNINAQINVPRLKQLAENSRLVILTSDTNQLYLSDPSILGVDDIVDKSDVAEFLKREIRNWRRNRLKSKLNKTNDMAPNAA